MDSLYFLDFFSDTIMPAAALFAGIMVKIYEYKPSTWILFYLALNSLIFGFSNYLANQNVNNIFIYNSFGVIENLIIGTLILSLINEKKLKITIKILLIFNLIFFLLKVFFDPHFFSRYSALIMLSSSFGQLICTVYFISKIFQEEIFSDIETTFSLIIGAFFIFNIGALALEFGYWQYSGRGYHNTNFIWAMYDILLLLKHAIILYSFIQIKKILNINKLKCQSFR